ncbi:MAG: hypothetical protein HY364_02910 [Candidatus Aenigmarchaeota archaeon]|nr:hypothetical protein [Candidatus Aenigmarchaeota archaeon]
MEVFLAGFMGGVIRGLVGMTKYLTNSPSKKRKLWDGYIFLTLLSSGGMGVLAGVFIAEDPRFALLAGYAGTDFVESLFKIKMKQYSW